MGAHVRNGLRDAATRRSASSARAYESCTCRIGDGPETVAHAASVTARRALATRLDMTYLASGVIPSRP